MNAVDLSEIIKLNLEKNLDELKVQFGNIGHGTDTRYFVLDDLLPPDIANIIYTNFPSNPEDYSYVDTFREKKFTFKNLEAIKNPIVANITDAFQDVNVIGLISAITEIDDLVADVSLYAGGISRMDKGHFLNPHIDNSHDANKKRYRRLNLLYYVTPEINEEDGGNFELWDHGVKRPLKITSKFNRLVVMETNKYAWHSVDPVLSDIQRCCVSNYYFSDSSPENYDYYHVTSFSGRPEEKFKRIIGKIDNILRNLIVNTTGLSRGTQNTRSKNKDL